MMRMDTIAIVGVGLIGGSIGKALISRRLATRVIGICRREESLQRALACRVVTEGTTDLAHGVADAGIVILCTPVETIIPLVRELSPLCAPQAIVTDTASTKAEIVHALCSETLPRPFVGGHPLAGSEQTGPEAARDDLFVGRTVILTPNPSASEAVDRIEAFWQSLGAKVLQMSPEHHDQVVAAISHLPHLVASALAAATPPPLVALAAGGWRDTTRVAAADPQLWREILLTNQTRVLESLARFQSGLDALREALQAADANQLEQLLTKGKQIRDALGD